MSEPEAPETAAAAPSQSHARGVLARRLTDIVCLPTSQITPQERHITGDLLIEMLRDGDLALRTRCARRVAALSDAPTALMRYLCRDDVDVARPLLQDSEALAPSDLVATARAAGIEHRVLIAQRREVDELVADALVDFREPAVLEALMRNQGAALSAPSIERMVADSRDQLQYAALLARRAELRPSQAFAMFWWSDADTRRALLRRFAVDRHMLQEATTDVFAMAAAEGWTDPVARKALQFIERRQRNRAAVDKSQYDSLEAAIDAAASHGLDRNLAEEISYLAGVKPTCGAQILGDLGGEPVGVLCKGAGLKREYFARLWTAMRRNAEETDEVWARAVETFDSLSHDKAQTVLRYWNWSLTSAFSPTIAHALELEGEDADEFSAAERTARLVFGRR